jgi:uncharacterized protein (DUF362 family)
MNHSEHLKDVSEHLSQRRNFLKGSLLFSTGLLLNQYSNASAASATTAPAATGTNATAAARSKVAFTTGTDRREMMKKVLTPFKDVIEKDIQGKQIIIKPNFVGTTNPLCATHVDAVRGVLDFLKPMYSGKIIIGESSATPNTMPGFQNYGYLDLEKEYNVTCQDFNTHTGTPYWILDRNLNPVMIQVISEFLDPKNYFISITRLKTHNAVIATMGLKNMAMGCPLNAGNGGGGGGRGGFGGGRGGSSKTVMHGASSRWLHYNLFLVSQKVRPQLSVIESVQGMEGNGPMSGTAVDHKVALAGIDYLAVDSIGAQLMDVPLENLGYLNFCANAGMGIIDRDRIDIIGNEKPSDHVIKYQLAGNIDQQLEWKQPLQFQGGQGGFGGGRGNFGGGAGSFGGGGFGGGMGGTRGG